MLDDLATRPTADLIALRATLEKYSDDQPRDEHGRWSSGGDAASAQADHPGTYFSWSGHSGQIRSALANPAGADPVRLAEGRQLITDVARYGAQAGPLYRGLRGDEAATGWHVGASVSMNLSSWSDSRETALGMSGHGTVLEVQSAHALNIQPDPTGRFTEHEYLTNGNFTVTGVRDSAGVRYVSLAQQDYFRSAEQAVATKAAKTITVSSGGARRDASLNPIIARVKQELIALAHEHANRVEKVDFFTDEAGIVHPIRDSEGYEEGGASDGGSKAGPLGLDKFQANFRQGSDRGAGAIGILAEAHGIGPRDLEGYAIRGEVKNMAATSVGARLDKALNELPNVDNTDIAQRALNYAQDYNRDGSSTGTQIADYLHNTWAETAGDHDDLALAVQAAAAEQLGIKDAANPQQVYGVGAISDIATAGDAKWMEENGPILRAYAQAEYDNTQAALKAAGIDSVEVYRGFRTGPATNYQWPAGTDTAQSNPLTSWSANAQVSAGFAGSGGVVLGMSVPADRVFSTPFTGAGCLNEQELVLLGGTDKVGVYRWDDPGGYTHSMGADQFVAVKAAEPKKPVNIDREIENADWPKRTPDHRSDIEKGKKKS